MNDPYSAKETHYARQPATVATMELQPDQAPGRTAGHRSRHQVHSEASWNNMQPFIRIMYARGTKQKDLVDELARRGFFVTLPQLKRRIKLWGIQRKVTKDEYLDIINRDGDKPTGSTFTKRGKVVKAHQLVRASHRYRKAGDMRVKSPSSGSGGEAATPDSLETGTETTSPGIATPSSSSTSASLDPELSSWQQSVCRSSNTLSVHRDPVRLTLKVEIDDISMDGSAPYGREADESSSFVSSDLEDTEDHLLTLKDMSLVLDGVGQRYLIQDRNHQRTILFNQWWTAKNCYYGMRFNEAENIMTDILHWMPVLFPKERSWLALSKSLLARVYDEQAKYSDAEKLHVVALSTAEDMLGVAHPATLAYKNHLATMLMHTGHLEQAWEFAQEVILGQTSLSEVRYIDKLYTHMTLGGILLRRGKHQEAQTILSQVASEFEENLPKGQYAVFTMRVEQEQARCYFENGDLVTAKALYKSSIEKQRNELGPRNHDTLSGMVRLARVLNALGEHQEAAENLLQVVEEFVKRYGPQHPVTLRARLELAAAYAGQNMLHEAIATQRIVIDANEGRLHKCPWILKGIRAALDRLVRLRGNADSGEEEIQMVMGLVRGMEKLQKEPPETTARCQEVL